jgi:hypothetical protein
MFCQPSILPPSIAAAWAATLCSIAGTVSGVVLGVTTAPFDSCTNDGRPPSGQWPRWVSHQKPSRLSNEWFSR